MPNTYEETNPDLTYGDVAPPKMTRKQAVAALEYHITDSEELKKYRIKKGRDNRWHIQYGKAA